MGVADWGLGAGLRAVTTASHVCVCARHLRLTSAATSPKAAPSTRMAYTAAFVLAPYEARGPEGWRRARTFGNPWAHLERRCAKCGWDAKAIKEYFGLPKLYTAKMEPLEEGLVPSGSWIKCYMCAYCAMRSRCYECGWEDFDYLFRKEPNNMWHASFAPLSRSLSLRKCYSCCKQKQDKCSAWLTECKVLPAQLATKEIGDQIAAFFVGKPKTWKELYASCNRAAASRAAWPSPWLWDYRG